MRRLGLCRRGILAIAVISLAGPASGQGGGTGYVVALEYLGPSNEWVCPLIMAPPGLPSAELDRLLPDLASRLRPRQMSPCTTYVPPREGLVIAGGLRALVAEFAASPFKLGVFRATIVEVGVAAAEHMLSAEESARALALIERACLPGACGDIGPRLAELRGRLSLTVPLQRVESMSDCGARAPSIDEAVQRRVVHDLTQVAPTWSVRTLLHSNTPAGRLLELTNAGLRVTVSVSYMVTSDDAARSLRCRLGVITMPRFQPVAGIGEEAFVLTSSHLLFRTGRFLLQIDAADQSIETERAVALRVIASIHAR